MRVITRSRPNAGALPGRFVDHPPVVIWRPGHKGNAYPLVFKIPPPASQATHLKGVSLFDQIRREYEFGIGSIVGVAPELGVDRRMVRVKHLGADTQAVIEAALQDLGVIRVRRLVLSATIQLRYKGLAIISVGLPARLKLCGDSNTRHAMLILN